MEAALLLPALFPRMCTAASRHHQRLVSACIGRPSKGRLIDVSAHPGRKRDLLHTHQEKKKILVVPGTDTIHHPNTMVVHFQNTPPTCSDHANKMISRNVVPADCDSAPTARSSQLQQPQRRIEPKKTTPMHRPHKQIALRQDAQCQTTEFVHNHASKCTSRRAINKNSQTEQ